MGRNPDEYPPYDYHREEKTHVSTERVRIFRTYEMEVGHHLTAGVPAGHKCRRNHGHRYEMEVEVSGTLDADGMLIEYAELDAIIKPMWSKVDHHETNDLNERCSTPEAAAVAANPTVERLVLWFARRLQLLASGRQTQAMRLEFVSIQEDSRAGARWTHGDSTP